MENPLVSMNPDENKPEEQNPNTEPAPKAPVAPEASEPQAPAAPIPADANVKPKKPFFTTGKIIAIFIGLVVIAAIVGAVIYYQSSEQFKGASFQIAPLSTTVQQQPIAAVTTAPLTTAPSTTTTAAEPCPSDKGLGETNDSVYGCTCNLDERTPNPDIWDPIDGVWTEDPVPYADPCVCPDDRPFFNSTSQQCEVITFAPLEVTTVVTPTTSTRPDVSTLQPGVTRPDITIQPEETCENSTATTDLINAYNQRNWDAYEGALQKLEDLGCIDQCKLNIYWTIFYLNTNNIDQAKVQFATFKKNCGTNCNLYFGYLGIVAEILSDIDQRSQTLTANLPGLNDEQLDFLRLVAEGYVNSCQCLELEQLLTNPANTLDSYFPSNVTSAIQLNTTNIKPITSTTNLSRLSSSLVVAYAQSYSPNVQSVLQSVLDTKCPPETKIVPNNCEALNIRAPYDVNSYVMSDLFDPTTDELEIQIIGGEDNIQDYKYTSASGTVKFDETSEAYNTQNKIVTLSGGPAEGETETITVTAIDKSGLPLSECTDSFTITRPAADQPICRSLEIVKPDAANQTGTPTVSLSANGFQDETLEIDVDADDGAYVDFLITSLNKTIEFDGEESLSTTSKTVKMNGGPAEGEEDTITVWARHIDTGVLTHVALSGIQGCNDAFTVKVPAKDEEPPPTLTYVPPTTTTEEPPPTLTYVPPTTTTEEPPPTITYVPPTTTVPTTTVVTTTTPTETTPIYVTTTQPQPTIITTTAPAMHAAAPSTPSTGPGLIIPLIATALGGAWIRRKKR